MDLPEYSDFKYQYTNTVMLNKQRELTINIKSCLSILNIKIHNNKEVKVEVAFDYQKVKERITVNYDGKNLNIKMKPEAIQLCNSKSKLDSYILITIPNDLYQLEINSDTFYSSMKVKQLAVEHFKLKAKESDIEIMTSILGDLDVEIYRGEINLNDSIGKNLEFYVTTGQIGLYNTQISDIINIKLQKGNIEMNDIKTNKIYSEVVVGNTSVSGLFGAIRIELHNQNGWIIMYNVYCDLIYLSILSGNLSFYNDDLVYYIDSLQYSLEEGEASFNINANIIKV